MISTITLFSWINVIIGKIICQYTRSFLKNLINLIFSSEYGKFRDKYEASAKFGRFLIIPPDFNLDIDLQFVVLYLQTF